MAGGKDHPRTCGEKCTLMLRRRLTVGSLPHMRGKANEGEIQLNLAGITPAHTGKRPRTCRSWTCSWDHPRVCGEKENLTLNPGANTGSPPRMRGKGKTGTTSSLRTRITPAYAGKRPTAKSPQTSPWDHPSACGEKRPSSAMTAS